MATARAFPSPSEPLPAIQRYFEISVYLMVATGIFSLLITNKLDILSVTLATGAILYKGVRIWQRRDPEITARTGTALVLAYFMFFPLDLWIFSRDLAAGSPNPMLYAGLLASIHLLIFATLVRLYSWRTTRDSIFLALLAFAAMLASAILTVDTSFLVALAIFLLLAVSSFVGLEIRRSSEGTVFPTLPAGSPAARRLQRALGLTSLLVAISALLIGALIFFLIPRFTAGYMSSLNLQPTLMTGFTDSVALGEIGQIQQSSAVVMRIQVQGNPAKAANIHWRGMILTDFDGRRWYSPSTNSVILTPDSAGTYHVNVPHLPSGSFYLLRYTVTTEPLGTDAIFVASHPESVWGHFGMDTGGFGHPGVHEYLLYTDTGTILNPLHNAVAMRYDAVSEVPSVSPQELRQASSTYPAAIRSMYLQLPPLDPRIEQLALRIAGKSPTAYDKAASIEKYLRTKFGYTLDLSDMRRRDPLSYFLFNKRAGNCEYFAAAMTVMLRTLGIPSRYVTGFLPGEYNDLAKDFIIRGKDAHSWVEVFFPGYGWISFDPTPPSNSTSSGLFSRLGMYWDWFQLNWNEWIINYDFSHQLALARDLHRSSRHWTDSFEQAYQHRRRATIDFLKLWQSRLAASPYSLPGALIFLVLLLLYFRGRRLGGFFAMRWGLRSHRRGQLPSDLAVFEYQQMLRLLERRGWRKAPQQTPFEFAASIPAPEFAAPAAQLTELYQAARFGAHPADAQHVLSLLRVIKELRVSRSSSARANNPPTQNRS